MSNFELYGELLTASVDDRTLSYRLLPFGEEGSTSIGKVVASKGTIQIPKELKTLVVNEEHDFKRPIGRIVSIDETDTGLNCTVSIARTSAGNDALELAASGLRAGISVEIADPIVRNGKLLGGNLTGAGLVVRSAFPSAQLVASDCGDLTSEKETTMENISNENLEAASAEIAPVVSQPRVMTAGSNKADIASITFEAVNRGGASDLNAALADQLTTDDAGQVYIGDQEVGELWKARQVERKLVNAVGVKPLNSLFVTGTVKNRTFAVADWAGNKAELPTGKFTTSRENWQASRKAVAVDIAMELIEFGGADVIADLYEQALDSYVEQTEEELTAALLAGATTIATAFSPIAAINKAASQLGSIGARMDFIVVSPDVFAELQEINSANAPWWLASQSSMDIRNGSVNVGGVVLTSNSALPDNTILVGDSRAVDYRESKDFRYKAMDIAHGGVDVSFIKLRATKITDAGAILKFTTVGTV